MESNEEPVVLTDRENMVLNKITELASKTNAGTDAEKVAKIIQFLGNV